MRRHPGYRPPRYRRKFEEIVRQAKVHGLSASVYTQTTDVEGEINGLLTYDREVAKAPAEAFARMARPLWEDASDSTSPPPTP